MTKSDLMAELAEVPLVAYAWRKDGMVGWALGHNPPTPNMPDFGKYEVRELTFRTHHAELEAVVRDKQRMNWLDANECAFQKYDCENYAYYSYPLSDCKYGRRSARQEIDEAMRIEDEGRSAWT